LSGQPATIAGNSNDDGLIVKAAWHGSLTI
jgi:hypothetical protein